MGSNTFLIIRPKFEDLLGLFLTHYVAFRHISTMFSAFSRHTFLFFIIFKPLITMLGKKVPFQPGGTLTQFNNMSRKKPLFDYEKVKQFYSLIINEAFNIIYLYSRNFECAVIET